MGGGRRIPFPNATLHACDGCATIQFRSLTANDGGKSIVVIIIYSHHSPTPREPTEIGARNLRRHPSHSPSVSSPGYSSSGMVVVAPWPLDEAPVGLTVVIVRRADTGVVVVVVVATVATPPPPPPATFLPHADEAEDADEARAMTTTRRSSSAADDMPAVILLFRSSDYFIVATFFSSHHYHLFSKKDPG